MFKKKFVSFGVLIVLIIACVVLVTILFVLASVPAVNVPASGTVVSEEPGSVESEDVNLPAPTVEEWGLPIVVSLTGSDSEYGLAAAWGFDYGIKSVNEMGGIRGLPVAITVRDAASSKAEVTNEIKALTSDSLVMMGPPTETAFRAGEQVFYDARMPAVGAVPDPRTRSALQPFAISCITDPDITSESVVATWIRMERITNVCIIYSSVYTDRVNSIDAALVYTGKQIADRVEVGNETFDAASIAKMATATEADAYYIDMSGEDTLRVVAQLRFLAGEDAGDLSILCGPMVADKELIDSALEGDMYGVLVWTTHDPDKDAEKRKAFAEAFDKNVGQPANYTLAVDYYQSALMLKQAFETLALTGDYGSMNNERETLAKWLYSSELIYTDHGDFFILDGGKVMEAKIFRITEKGFQ